MALHWQWSEKAGTVTQVQTGRDGEKREFVLNFYTGNALMIALYEYEEDDENCWDMMWFFTGEEHAMNCLGLHKPPAGPKENMFGEDGITQLTIYREYCPEWQLLCDLFTRAFPHISITILEKAPDTNDKEA